MEEKCGNFRDFVHYFLECLSVRGLLHKKLGIRNHTQAKLLECLYFATWHVTIYWFHDFMTTFMYASICEVKLL